MPAAVQAVAWVAPGLLRYSVRNPVGVRHPAGGSASPIDGEQANKTGKDHCARGVVFMGLAWLLSACW